MADGMTGQTLAEHRLVNEMQQRLGAPLSTFLLTGYCEAELKQSITYLIWTAQHQGPRRYWLNVRTIDVLGLPCQREPLVLLALLRVLLTRDELTIGVVPFPAPEVHQVLGWQNTDETNSIINQALNKYFNLSYRKMYYQHDLFPDATAFAGQEYRLLTSYEFSVESEDGEPGQDLAYMDVSLNFELVEGIRDKRLFGLDWKAVTSMQRLPTGQEMRVR